MFFPLQPLRKKRRRLVNEVDFLRRNDWLVFQPFGGHIYSYPEFDFRGTHGNAASVIGLYGCVALVVGSLSFSVIETLVLSLASVLDAETGLLPYWKNTGDGISGVVGWFAGHNFTQLFFKERRNWCCAGGLSVVLFYIQSWLAGDFVSHAAHFQTLGAGILSAIVMRSQFKTKPVRWLANNSGKVTAFIIVGLVAVVMWAKQKWPSQV